MINGIKPANDRERTALGRLLAAIALPTLVAGCGFQLAGTGNLPAAMQMTYLDSGELHSEFYDSLSEVLRQRGLSLVESRAGAGARLIISEDSSGQRVLSVTARNIPREYEVFYAVTFSLETEGQAVVGPVELVARRNYTYDETEVLGKEREESILRRALAEDLARQVIRRIESATQTTPLG